MATLIAYYSRTGTNEKLAIELYKELRCDVEKIADTKSRAGLLGYLTGGFAAARKKPTKIGKIKKDPSKYDIVILVYPIWVGKMPPAVRAYLLENRDKIKKAAVLSVAGSGANKGALADFEKTAGKRPIASLLLAAKELKSQEYKEKLGNFVKSVH